MTAREKARQQYKRERREQKEEDYEEQRLGKKHKVQDSVINTKGREGNV